MQITLNWTNRNTGEDGIRIYRAEAPLNPAALPAPLATLPPGSTTYNDATAVQGVTYYYRTEVFKGADKALSLKDIVILGKATIGPGPQALLQGTPLMGFYGETTGSDLLTYPELISLVEMSGVGSVMGNIHLWLKFAYKGKVLFVAKQGISNSMSWLQLYNKGLVYGVDGFGTDLPAGVAGVSQNKIITVKGNEYRVRLLKGLPGSSGTITSFASNLNDVTEDLTGSEWNDLMYRISARSDLRFGPPMADRFRSVDVGISQNYSGTNGIYTPTFCQERAGGAAATQIVVRGGRSKQYAGYPYYMGAGSAMEHNLTSISKPIGYLDVTVATSFYACWRPVLELLN